MTEQLMNDARRALMLELGLRQSPDDNLYPMSARAVEALRDSVRATLHHLEQQKQADGDAARTPTGDEREALIELLGPILHLPIRVIRDNILAAGFRRSEVPEPSATVPTSIELWHSKVIGMPYLFHTPTEGVVAQESEARRQFTAAYRASNGNVISLETPNMLREAAEKTVAEFTDEDPEGPDYFVATRTLPSWVPVKHEGTEQ